MNVTHGHRRKNPTGVAVLALGLWLIGIADANCPASFDPEGVAQHKRIASWHPEYSDPSATVNCQGMDESTMKLGNHFVAAVEDARYAGGLRCGTCAQVMGPKGSTIVKIIDQCPTCSARGRGLDLSPEAFKAINDGNLGDGVVDITWRTVSCPVNNANPYLKYRFKQGSGKWWMQLQCLFNRDPIKKVEMAFPSDDYGTYWQMKQTDHSFWKFKNKPPRPYKGPMKVRLTSTGGQTVTDTISEIKPYSEVIQGKDGVQFDAACPASGTTSTTTAPTGGGTGSGTCGKGRRGNGICANGMCCSQYGWCGTSDAHCRGKQGAESEGSCPGNLKTEGMGCSSSSECCNRCKKYKWRNGVKEEYNKCT